MPGVSTAYLRVLPLLMSMMIPFGLHGIPKVCAAPAKPTDPDVFVLTRTDPSDVEAYKTSPPKLPHIELECSVNAPDITMPAYHKMSTIEEFRDELEKLKSQYSPFLENKAPAAPLTRARLNISTFQFRMEKEPEDQQDIGRIFSGEGEWENVAIPHYRGPNGWWKGYYRKVLDIPDDVLAQDTQILHFGAVSYFCDVYLNGRLVGSHTGWWAPFEIDLTPYLRRDGENVLVIEIRNEAPPQHGNNNGRKIMAATSPGWDDPKRGWHCNQSGGGIWQTCYLEGRPKIHITDIFVRPNIDDGFIDTTIQVYQPPQYYQNEKHPRVSTNVDITVSIYPKNFNGAAIENITIPTSTPAGALYSEYVGRIKLENFRQWDLETPYLYTIRATVQPKNGKGKPDCQDAHFGMRKFTMDETTTPKGTFYFNNREIILRGANTMGHMQRAVMEGNLDQVIEDILIAKMANINYWRLTQRPVQPEIYDLCDRLGILTQTDLPLFGQLSRYALAEAVKQAGEMELLVRNHPSNILISYINETNGLHLDNLRYLNRQELERFFEAATQVVKIHNPDRVIKPIEGDMFIGELPPGFPDIHNYALWYGSTIWWLPYGQMHRGYSYPAKPGWKFGMGEYGIEGLEAAQTMFKYYPKEWLPESVDDQWNPDKIIMAQTWKIHSRWFDTQNTMRQWIEASQNHQAWGTRMMTRALRRNKDNISSAVHLLIDAWPAGWMKALIDVDRIPKKAYFEYRDAITPLMVDIRTDRTRYYVGQPLAMEFWVCNDKVASFPEGKLIWEVWQGAQRLFAQSSVVEIPSYDPKFAGFFHYKSPSVHKRTSLKIRLGLLNPDGKVVHVSEQEVEIFPVFNKEQNADKIAVIAGEKNGRAWRLAKQLGLKPTLITKTNEVHYSIIIVDTPEYLEEYQDIILGGVNSGQTALLLEQPSGAIYHIGNQDIKVTAKFDMEGIGREFVSRKTGHRLVEGFEQFDFAYWYNPEKDYIDCLVDAYLEVEPISSPWPRQFSPKAMKFNFAPHNSFSVQDYIHSDGSLFEADLGYGWNKILHSATRKRGIDAKPELDTGIVIARGTKEGIFSVVLPNGQYGVTPVGGDAAYPTHFKVYAESELLCDCKLNKGQWVSDGYEVTVIDGQLDISFVSSHDRGLSVACLIIEEWGDMPAKRIAIDKAGLQSQKWYPILVTGAGSDMKSVVVEKELGKGSIIISQLKAGNRVEHNPVAAEFYQRIIDDAVLKQ